MSEERILVVLPTLGERLQRLEETLDSVVQQENDVDISLVVVLPAAAQQARLLAEERGARIVVDPGEGISSAINLALRSARADETLYAWIGDDDLFRPGGLKRLFTLLQRNPGSVLAYGACDYIDDDGSTLFTNRAGALAKWLLPWGPDLIPHPGSLIRIDAMHEVGLFDPELKYAMDLDLFLRLRSRGSFVSTRHSVSAFRWHAGSITVANRAASSAEAQRVKHRHLPRILQPVSPVWETPVAWVASYAARSISRRAPAP